MISLKAKHRNIIRFDLPATMTHGWLISFNYHGLNHKQFIRDDLVGGRLSSLRAAISWRDKTKERLSVEQAYRAPRKYGLNIE